MRQADKTKEYEHDDSTILIGTAGASGCTLTQEAEPKGLVHDDIRKLVARRQTSMIRGGLVLSTVGLSIRFIPHNFHSDLFSPSIIAPHYTVLVECHSRCIVVIEYRSSTPISLKNQVISAAPSSRDTPSQVIVFISM